MIEYVDINHAAEADEFVKNHPKCHFEQISDWGRVKQYDDWTSIICRGEDGKIRGVMAILHSRINHTKYYRLYAPRGPIFDDGDFETFRELIEAAKQLADKVNAVVIKIDPMVEEGDDAFMTETVKFGFACNKAADFSLSNPRVAYVTDLRGLTEDDLIAKYHRTLRYHVRRSEKSGLVLRRGTVDDVDRFIDMMSQTGEKNGFKPHSKKYYTSYLTNMPDIADFYIAEEDGVTVAATFTAELGNRMWYMYGCSDQSRLDNHPNEFLQWKMQCHAIEKGYDWFDMRGVEGFPTEDNPHYGLHRYKKSMGADFKVYCGEFTLVTKPLAYKAINALKKII